MKFRQYFLLVIFLLSYAPIFAQVYEAWVKSYNGPANSIDFVRDLTIDGSGYIYVTGQSAGSGTNYDYAIIKYSVAGDTIWTRRFNGPANSSDVPAAIAIDGVGNIYVTGASGVFGKEDYLTVKYSPAGDTLWTRSYNGPADSFDFPNAMVVDDPGNVYITGQSVGSGSSFDFATVKYSPSGTLLWVTRYNGTFNSNDRANAVTIDNSGNVYVTGEGNEIAGALDFVTIKYNSNGDTLWLRKFDSPGVGEESPVAIALDKNNDVHVVGRSFSGGNQDYLTVKYSSSGDTIWTRRYNGPANGNEYPQAMVVDDSGSVIVTGFSPGNGSGYDFATVKHYPNGDTAWVRRYNGTGNQNDNPSELAIGPQGEIYVVGIAKDSVNLEDYVTLGYSSAGDSLWVQIYNGPANSVDFGTGIGAYLNGEFFVTGSSYSGANYDFVTIKYSPCSAKPGDVTGDGQVLLPDIVAIINFLFKSQPAPNPLCRGDANGNGVVLLPDIVYLINFIFKSGAAPVKSGQCCL